MLSKVYVEITNVCNLSCSFCVGTRRKAAFMSRESFERILRQVRPYTEFLYFHLMGEPLLHPELEYFLKSAKESGFKVIITTNGAYLHEKGDILLSSGALFKINISLHAYEANSPNLFHERYFDDCFDFAEKAASGGIITVFRLWNGGGEDKFNGMIINRLRERFDGEWADNTKGIRIRKKLFIEHGDKFDWPLTSEKSDDNVTCYGLRDHFGILCDGTVVPCCLDYDGNLSLGNIFSDDISTILSSEKALSFRNALDRRISPSVMCRRCGFAQNKFAL